MRLELQLDDRQMRESLERWSRQRSAGRRAAARVAGDTLVRQMLRNSPRDTRRYVRAWAEAGRDLDLGPFPSYRLRRPEYLGRVNRQLAFWEDVLRRLDVKARGQIRDRRGFRIRGLTIEQKSLLYQARAKVRRLTELKRKLIREAFAGLGGRGDAFETRDRLVWELHNLERYASYVERQHRVFARSARAVERRGPQVARAYLEAIDRGVGLGDRNG